MARALVFVASFPLLSRTLPGITRGALALVLSVTLLPIALASTQQGAAEISPALVLGELLIGLSMALLAGSAIWAAEIAASLIKVTTFPAALSPQIEELFGLFSVVILLGAGAHRPVLLLLADSYSLLPAGAGLGADFGPGAVLAGRAMLAGGFALAAPVLATTLVSRLLAASLTRGARSLAYAWPEASITTLLGLAVVSLLLLTMDTATLQLFGENIHQLPRLLGGRPGLP